MSGEGNSTTTESPEAQRGGQFEKDHQRAFPRAFGPYVLLRQMAKRGPRSLYLSTAHDLGSFQKLCLIKQISGSFAAESDFETRFIEAGRRLVHLDHRNVAQVFDSGQIDGVFYLAQEFVCGCSLDELAIAAGERNQPIPIDLAVLIFVDLTRGLYHALRQTGPDGRPQRLWHGRVAPHRVLISVEGEVKLIGYDREWIPAERNDDETASLYLAPEFETGAAGGPTADVFAVARLLLSLVRMGQVGDVGPEALDEVKSGLGDLVASALSDDPNERPKDVGGLLRPLRAALHRLNPSCGPLDLQDYIFGALGDILAHRIANTRRLLKNQVGESPTTGRKVARTRTLLLEDDEKVRARAVDRIIGEDVPLTGMLPGTKYKLLRPIGEGGMGTVYAAEHVDLEKIFALKILRQKKRRDQTSIVEVLRREARATSKLGQPTIISVTDVGETPDGRVFFVMEYLEGQSLGELLEEHSSIEAMRLIRILIQVCEGLAAAHEKGVVHRDIKPDNIFLTVGADGSEVVKLLDFGVAVPTGTNRPQGNHIASTPYYMSPEMIRLEPLDGRADLYSVGVLAYEALSGRRPFGPAPVLQLLKSHLKDEPAPLRSNEKAADVHADLEAIVMRALKKKPDARFPDATTMAAELRALLDLVREWPDREPSFATVSFESKQIQREIEETWASALKQSSALLPTLEGATFVAAAEPVAIETAEEPSKSPWKFVGLVGLFLFASAVVALSFLIGDEDDTAGVEGPEQPGGNVASVGAEGGRGTPLTHLKTEGSNGADAAVRRAGDAAADASSRRSGDGGLVGDADEIPSTPRAAQPTRGARARNHAKVGQQALSRGQLDLAETEFRRALSLSSRRHDALSGLGRVEFQRGNYSKASHFAQRALERNPDSARYRLQLGAALFRSGQTRDAELLFRQVLSDQPNNPTARRYLEAVQRR